MHNARVSTAVTGAADCLRSYGVLATGYTVKIAPPVFEIDGTPMTAALTDLAPAGEACRLPNGVEECAYARVPHALG